MADPFRFFAFRLAGSLNCTVDELDDRVTPERFFEYIAFDQLSPIGGERLDYVITTLATIMANAWGKKKWKWTDLLPKWGRGEKKKKISFLQLQAWALSHNRAFLEQEKRKRGRSVD